MAPADDRPNRERTLSGTSGTSETSATSALGSTSLLMAAIVLMSAVGSFAAVRVWFPKKATSPEATAAVGTTSAATPPVQQVIDVRREIEKPATAGRLSIVTDPAGARVAVDGRPRGVSPVVIDGLAATEHHISVVSDTGVAERTIAVANDVMTEVVFSLPRPTAPLAGWLAIKSPFPVEMLEHDEVVGVSGAPKTMLAAGTHQVVLRNQALGFEASRTIVVVAGQVTAVGIDPPKALLNANARPWADVLVDGEMVGQTPLGSLPVAIGPHQVVFRNPQFGERTEQVIVTARGVNRVAVDFNK